MKMMNVLALLEHSLAQARLLVGFRRKIEDTNSWFGKSRRTEEVLPVWRAPVSRTTGWARADRSRPGSTSRGIRIC
jgi:hypothetical protein